VALRSTLTAATLGLAFLAGTCTMAQGLPPPARREPPPEAFQACEGKTEGTTVTLTMPDGKTLQGTCRLWKGALVAMPAGGPPSGGPAPSQ